MKLSDFGKSFALAGAMWIIGASLASAESLPQALANDVSGQPVLSGDLAKPNVLKAPNGFLSFVGMPNGQTLKNVVVPVSKASVKLSDKAEAFFKAKRDLFCAPSERVSFKVGKSKASLSGRTYSRLSQFYAGVPVFDAQAVVGTNSVGDVTTINSSVMREYGKLEALNLAPKIDGKAAVAAACWAGTEKFGSTYVFDQTSEPTLGVYAPEVFKKDGEPQLVWRTDVFSVYPTAQIYRFFISAEDGVALDGYSLRNDLTPIDRAVYDQANDAWPSTPEDIELLAADNPDPALFPPALRGPDDENYCTTCPDVRNTFNFMGMMYNYTAESFNHEVSPWISPSNARAPGYLRAFCRFSEDGEPMLNAFFANLGAAPVYPLRPYTAGFYFGDGVTADDVVAHEMGHAISYDVVTDEYGNVGGLVYQNESGALNEFFSDFFGESFDLTHRIQFFPMYSERLLRRGSMQWTHNVYDGDGNILDRHFYRDQDDTGGKWLIGEDMANRDLTGEQTFSTVDPPVTNSPTPAVDPHPILGGARAMRNMANPPEFGLPDRKYSPLYYTGTADNGGVHYNCGVASKLYYLLTEGDTFRSKTITGMGLRGIQSRLDKFKPMFDFVIDPVDNPYEYRSRVDSSKLFWEVLQMLTPNSDYTEFATALMQAGNDYQLSEEQMYNLGNALWVVDLFPGDVADAWDGHDEWSDTTKFPDEATMLLMKNDVQTQNHKIGFVDVTDTFRTQLVRGYTYNFSIPTQGCDLRLTLFDPTLKQVAQVTMSEGLANSLDYYAVLDGPHFLLVEPATATYKTCDYTISWRTLYSTLGDAWDPTDNNIDNATAMPIPVEAIGTHGEHTLDNTAGTTAYDYEDWFKFTTLFAGVTYEFQHYEGFGSTIGELYNSKKQLVERDIYGSAGFGKFKIRFKPTVDDTYYLRVKANGNIKVRYYLQYREYSKLSVGDSWDPYDDEKTGAIRLADPVKYAQLHGEHSLGYNNDLADWFVVRLVAGRTYVFDTKSGVSTGSTMASLYDAAGRLLAQDSKSGSDNQFRVVYTPKQTGDFYLRTKPTTVYFPATAGISRYTLQYSYK